MPSRPLTGRPQDAAATATAGAHDRAAQRIMELLDRLLETRAARDEERRWSARWHALDAEMHRIERSVFHATVDVHPVQRAKAPRLLRPPAHRVRFRPA